MKICLIAPIPPFRGGIAKYCHSLAQELERRHDLLLLSYRRQYPALLYGRKSQIDPAVDRNAVRREFRNLSYDIDSANPASWYRTARAISAFAPDLVVLPWWVAYWAPMYLYLHRYLAGRGIRCLFLCINVYEHEDHPLKKWLTRCILGRGDDFIVHSDQEAREILSFNPTATVNTHLLPLFEYPATAAGKRDAPLHVLFFGFVRPYKGLDILLEAVAMLKHRGITLTIAGEFWDDKGKYLALIDDLGIADRVAVIDRYLSDGELCGYVGTADLVVVPYLQSRTSGVIATAYGCGKPVLATDVGGFSKVVRDGITGKIVAPGDPAALAEGIEWFMANGEIDFTANIGKFAAEEMSWGSLVDMIEGLLRTQKTVES